MRAGAAGLHIIVSIPIIMHVPICVQVLLALVQPYTRVRIPFISSRLNIPEKDVEQLLVQLILDNRINGFIDQVCVYVCACRGGYRRVCGEGLY